LKTLQTISVAVLTAFLLLSPLAVLAQGATVTVHTDTTSYSGAQSLTVFGTVSPTPTTTTYISITAKSPTGATVLSGVSAVSTSDGSYSQGFVTGGSSSWTSGTYTVNATYVSGTISGSETTTFAYSSSTSSGSGISQQQYNDIIGNITALSTQLTTLSTTLQMDLNGNFSLVSGLSANISAISAKLTTLSSELSGNFTALSAQLTVMSTQLKVMNSTLTTINNNAIAAQKAASQAQASAATAATAATNASNDNSNTQTYVLVVAVLAAIDLVLVLAVLIRKLS